MMKLISIFLLLFIGNYVTNSNSINFDLESNYGFFEVNNVSVDYLVELDSEMLMCCANTPCANALYQCNLAGGDPNDCIDEYYDCLDDLYGSDPGEHP